MKIKRILLFLITLTLFGCVKEYDIKVIRATDSRYPSINNEEFGLVLEKTKEIMREYFNIKIGYSYIGEEGMLDFFDKYSKRVTNPEKRFWEKRRCNIFSPGIKEFRADIFNYLKKYKMDKLKNEWGGVFTTFPFLSEIEFLKSERDTDYPDAQKERLEIIAYQMCHELTHLLLKYDDAYDHPNCILNPPKGLRYKEWYDGIIKAGRCPKKHK